MAVGESSDDRESGLRNLTDVTDAQQTAPRDDLTRLGQPVLVEPQPAVVHLDDRATLHRTDRDGHAGPRRRVLRGVGEQFRDQVDQRLDHRRGDPDIGVAGDLHAFERDDPARSRPHHVDQRQGLLPLLTGPLAAQHLEALGVPGLLCRRMVHLHGGLEEIRVGRVTLRHTRDRRLDPVCRGLDPARQLDQRDPLRLLTVADDLGHIGEEPVVPLGEFDGQRLLALRGRGISPRPSAAGTRSATRNSASWSAASAWVRTYACQSASRRVASSSRSRISARRRAASATEARCCFRRGTSRAKTSREAAEKATAAPMPSPATGTTAAASATKATTRATAHRLLLLRGLTGDVGGRAMGDLRVGDKSVPGGPGASDIRRRAAGGGPGERRRTAWARAFRGRRPDSTSCT